jgi:hypothetical protein
MPFILKVIIDFPLLILIVLLIYPVLLVLPLIHLNQLTLKPIFIAFSYQLDDSIMPLRIINHIHLIPVAHAIIVTVIPLLVEELFMRFLERHVGIELLIIRHVHVEI